MIYQLVHNNFHSLIQNAGVLKRAQIFRFFEDEASHEQIERMLKQFVNNNYINYNSKTDCYMSKKFARVKPKYEHERIRAFWPVAYMGSLYIQQIYLLQYPFQYAFITSENLSYDIAVVNSRNEALDVRTYLLRFNNTAIPDDVNHIALVENSELGSALKDFGFNMYVMLDPVSNEPFYEKL